MMCAGSLSNTSADQNSVDWQIVPKGDIHHYTFQFHIMDNYIVLANQNVQQPYVFVQIKTPKLHQIRVSLL